MQVRAPLLSHAGLLFKREHQLANLTPVKVPPHSITSYNPFYWFTTDCCPYLLMAHRIVAS